VQIISSYVHALDGRLRIKIPEVKNAPLKAREVEHHLKLLPGVEQVSANPVTGNVLILYNPNLISQAEIVLALRELGYLQEQPSQGSKAAGSAQNQDHFLTKVTTTVASALMEAALSRLVAALI